MTAACTKRGHGQRPNAGSSARTDASLIDDGDVLARVGRTRRCDQPPVVGLRLDDLPAFGGGGQVRDRRRNCAEGKTFEDARHEVWGIVAGSVSESRCGVDRGVRSRDAACQPKPRAKRAISEGWYRYGDSNPGPVAENHVS